MPLALFALAAGAFGIGMTEFVIMGLLLEVSVDLGVTIKAAGLLVSAYALGVVFGAPVLTVLMARFQKKAALLALMLIFIVGNLACAIGPTYPIVFVARVITAFAHGTYFGIGSVVAVSLVGADRRASAIAILFTGLTTATIIGVPVGTWIGQAFDWRATFALVAAVGVLAAVAIGLWVPGDAISRERFDWRAEMRALACRPVILGLATTVLGYAAVFAVFTYIAPLLTQISGYAESAVSPILLVFGGGLIAGNLLGGRLADGALVPTVIGALLALAVVLGLMSFALESPLWSVVFVGLLGASAFATVAPLQTWVLSKAQGAGQSLAASFNIAAFNLGNALGAWFGGVVITDGPGLGALTSAAAFIPIAAAALAVYAIHSERRRDRSGVASAPITPVQPHSEDCP